MNARVLTVLALTGLAARRARADGLAPALRLRRPPLFLVGKLRRPSARDALAQGAHVRVVVAQQRCHGFVDAGRAAQLHGWNLRPVAEPVSYYDTDTRQWTSGSFDTAMKSEHPAVVSDTAH